MNIYITADRIGIESGGGQVTAEELRALDDFSREDRSSLGYIGNDGNFPPNPFEQDQFILGRLKVALEIWTEKSDPPKIAHCYAGCLTETVAFLKSLGTKVTYTAAAHDVEVSRREHAALGVSFDYPHLTDPELWSRYLGGYLAADVVVCPSTYSARTMRGYGAKDVRVIPHGHYPPEKVTPTKERPPFVVGYLGAVGPDKGLVYLFKAWAALKKLGELGDMELHVAGSHSQSGFVGHLMRLGGLPPDEPSVKRLGWVKNVSDFYENIHLYVQPSVSEGFGLEVVEAMAHSRFALCSLGAGAYEHAGILTFPSRDYLELATAIVRFRKMYDSFLEYRSAEHCAKSLSYLTWSNVRKQYVELWKSLTEKTT